MIDDHEFMAEANKARGRLASLQRRYGNPEFPESAVILSGLIEATKPASQDIMKPTTLPEFTKAQIMAFVRSCAQPDPVMAYLGRKYAEVLDREILESL